MTSHHTLATLWKLEGVFPWATGTRNLFITIDPHSINGAAQAPFAD